MVAISFCNHCSLAALLAIHVAGALGQQLRGVKISARASGLAVGGVEAVNDRADLGERFLGDLPAAAINAPSLEEGDDRPAFDDVAVAVGLAASLRAEGGRWAARAAALGWAAAFRADAISRAFGDGRALGLHGRLRGGSLDVQPIAPAIVAAKKYLP